MQKPLTIIWTLHRRKNLIVYSFRQRLSIQEKGKARLAGLPKNKEEN
jgi:hypothetical protein